MTTSREETKEDFRAEVARQYLQVIQGRNTWASDRTSRNWKEVFFLLVSSHILPFPSIKDDSEMILF
jgi:hypothetical protein